MANEQGHKKGGGLFGGQKHEEQPQGPSISFVSQELTSLSTRFRVLEERTDNMRKKQRLIEKGMLDYGKKYAEEIDLLKDEVSEIRRVMREMESKIILIIKELRLCPKKEEVDILKRYIELWEPANFVTQQNVENIVEDIVEAKLHGSDED